MYNILTKFNRHLIILLTVFGLFFSQSALASTKEASAFINDLAERVIALVKRADLSETEKEKELSDIFIKSVDTKWIAKFSMGRYWRTINSEQQNQFLDIYSNYLTGLYIPNFRQYTSNVVKIIGSSQVRANEYLVQTILTNELNTMSIKIDYHLMQKNKGIENFVIFDVVAEGVSLITSQRAEISSIMDGGDFNALVALLTKKTNNLAK